MEVLPLGLSLVAKAAEAKGHQVELSQWKPPLEKESVVSFVRKCAPDIIGISVRNIDDQCMDEPLFLLPPVKELVSICKEAKPDIPVVLGGAGYSIFPEQALEYLGGDMGIQGEGEASFPALVSALEQKTPLSEVPGLFLPGKSQPESPRVFSSPDTLFLPDPDTLSPFLQNIAKEDAWIPFQTRRGCPMRCIYCSTPKIEGRRTRVMPPERVVEALSGFCEKGYNRFFFVDNTFNLPPGYCNALLDEIISSGISILWRCIFYPKKTPQSLIRKMADAGCFEVALGAESCSMEMLSTLRKGFSPKEVAKLADQFKKEGFSRVGFLLFGGPGETKASVLESLDLMDSLNLEGVKITPGIRIYPDTELSGLAVSKGMITNSQSLLFPAFYMEEGIREWLVATLSGWSAKRPGWFI